MTKKDFNAIAAVFVQSVGQMKNLYAAQERAGLPAAMDGLRTAAVGIANVCARSNPRFDRARFLAACGFND